MMTAHREIPRLKTLVVVADEPAVRESIRRAFAGEGHYIFECQIADLHTLIRSVQVDAITVIGERTGLLVAQLREALAGARIAARHISFVGSAKEAREALVRACETP